MNLEKVLSTYDKLIEHMTNHGYSDEYIKSVMREVLWIKKNKDKYSFITYEDIFNVRESFKKKDSKYCSFKTAINILRKFDELNELPCHHRDPLVKKGAYYKLCSYYTDIVDSYRIIAESEVKSKNTIKKCIVKSSCFFLHLQNLRHFSLDSVQENDVTSFFSDGSGTLLRGRSYKRDIVAVLKSHNTIASKRILLYLPVLPKRHNNVDFLKKDEVEAIRNVLLTSDKLSYRDRAIGIILFYTGMRAGDVAELRFNEIDWDNDIIRLSQHKTRNLLELPLSATVGNAIYDYIINEHPTIDDDHIFLWSVYPYSTITSDTIWQITAKIYRLAEVRQTKDARRGSHIFRHHLATSLGEHGFSQPVISDTLGHSDPYAVNYYLSADIVHLRELALSIEPFQIKEEVFDFE